MSLSELPCLRVLIQQPALPKYRVAFFQRLASQGGMQTALAYGSEEPALTNAQPDGFTAKLVPFQTFKLPITGALHWHSAQWRAPDKAFADVVVLSWNARFISLVPALLRARWRGIPAILWGHGVSKTPSRWRRFARLLPVKLAQAVILYDPVTRQQLLEEGLNPAKLFVAPNGLDSQAIRVAAQPWEDDQASLRAFKAKHGLADGPCLIHVGRLMPQNSLDTAIRALPAMLGQFPQLKLIVVGSGTSEQARLQKLAESCGVQEALVWTGPIYDEPKLAPWMLSATAVIYPRNAGLGLIHGFNYSLPAIICGPRSLHGPEAMALEHNHNGLIIENNHDEELAQAVTSLFADTQRLNQMAQAARQTALERHNTIEMVEGFRAAITYCTNAA